MISESKMMQDNLDQVWNERDPEKRLEAIRRIYAAGARLYHVGEKVTGPDAINNSVTATLAHLPQDFVFTRLRPVVINNGIGRLIWGAGPKGQPPVATGMDIAYFDNGRIASLYVFLDSQAAKDDQAHYKKLHKNKMTNKEIVLKAMDEFFHQRNTTAIVQYWHESYQQHNPSMINGHQGLKDILAILDTDFKWTPGIIVEQGDIVITHSLVHGWGPVPVIVVDIFRLEDGKIAEHWDVVQEEVPASRSASGNAMTSF